MHSLTITHTYRDGLANRFTSPDQPGPAEAAQKNLEHRVRYNRRIPFERGSGWIEYDERQGTELECTVRVEWHDAPGEGGARWKPEDLERLGPPKPGHVVLVECDDATGRKTDNFVVREVDELGCGCYQLRGVRPGWLWPAMNEMEVLTGCETHRTGIMRR